MALCVLSTLLLVPAWVYRRTGCLVGSRYSRRRNSMGVANWGRNEINIDVNRYNRFNRSNITNGRWEHNVAHRKGVPYANRRLNDQFRRPYQGNFSASREQFRGRAEAGRAALARRAASGALARQALRTARRSCLREQARPIAPEQRPLTEPGSGNVRRASDRGRDQAERPHSIAAAHAAFVVAVTELSRWVAAVRGGAWPRRATLRHQGQARYRPSWPAFKRDGPLSVRVRWKPKTLCRRDCSGSDRRLCRKPFHTISKVI